MIDSICLDPYQIPSFYHLLEDYGIVSVAPQKKFEVYRGRMNGSIISISANGQVSYSNDRTLQELVDIVLEDLSTPDTREPTQPRSSYMVLARPSLPRQSQHSNHLNIWLDQLQFDHAIDLFDDHSQMVNKETDYDFEIRRYGCAGDVIRFHHNGKIIAENGYSNFAGLLRDAIRSHLPYADYDLIIGQDEVGNGEHIGPLVVGSVAASPQQMVDMQLVGVKDSKMVPRQITKTLSTWIRDLASLTTSFQLPPAHYNQVKLDHELSTAKMLIYAHNQAVTTLKSRLKQLGLVPDRVLYLVDQFAKYEKLTTLTDQLDFNVDVQYLPNGEQQSISVAAASIRAKSDRNLWSRKYQKLYNVSLKRKHLNKLRQHPKAHRLLKSI